MLFKELFRNYKYDINPTNNWTIKQYSLLDDGTVNYDEETDPVPSSDKVNGVMNVQKTVLSKQITFTQGVALLHHVFGYPIETSKLLLSTVIQE